MLPATHFKTRVAQSYDGFLFGRPEIPCNEFACSPRGIWVLRYDFRSNRRPITRQVCPAKRYRCGRYPRILAGKNRIDLTSAKTAPTPIPISRNGMDSNQTKGHATRASMATGQLNKKRMHQPMSNRSAFMGSGLVSNNSDRVQRHGDGGLAALGQGGFLRNAVERQQHGSVGHNGQQCCQSDGCQACCGGGAHVSLQFGAAMCGPLKRM